MSAFWIDAGSNLCISLHLNGAMMLMHRSNMSDRPKLQRAVIYTMKTFSNIVATEGTVKLSKCKLTQIGQSKRNLSVGLNVFENHIT